MVTEEETKKRGGAVTEEDKKRGGGINVAEGSEPAAVEDVSPHPQDVCSPAAAQPPPRFHGDGREGAHLPAGDPHRADSRPVEGHQSADRQTAGKINNYQ